MKYIILYNYLKHQNHSFTMIQSFSLLSIRQTLGSICYTHTQAVTHFALLAPITIEILSLGIRYWSEADKTALALKQFSFDLITAPRKALQAYSHSIRKVVVIGTGTAAFALSSFALYRLGVTGYVSSTSINWLKSLSIIERLAVWSRTVNIWRLPIPGGEPFVYIGYTALAGANLYKSWQRLKERSPKALTSLTGALIALGTLAEMVLLGTEVRWHHSGYGLLMMLAPFRSVEFFGTLMTLDSSLYWFTHRRFDYDFANIFVENFSHFTIQMVALSSLQLIFSKKRLEEVEPNRLETI
ncbi:putative membrane protein [Candidatus Protochlamydia naegleriophila]|uniref:Putative membrane protein n=2 Tax=Candidatus Protochlamydia naegleriophila TaxID=389348 RepID=A0A0U5JDX1_9BACT|nr:putative membrane protein [Candidatus Protochlamydia naegleriophila]